MKRFAWGVTLLMLMSIGQSVRAELLFDRGLPYAPLNNNPERQGRSNVRWTAGYDNQQYYGDDFVIGEAGESYLINHIRTWAVLGYRDDLPDEPDELGDWFSRVKLLGGLPSDQYLPALANGELSLNSSTSSNSDVVISRVAYPDEAGSLYDNFGQFITIWQLDFHNLNWVVEGGTRYNFSVQGTGRQFGDRDYFHAWFNHASSARFRRVPQEGADNLMLIFSDRGEFIRVAEAEEHWENPSDINIQIFGEQLESAPSTEDSSSGESSMSIPDIVQALHEADLLTGRTYQRSPKRKTNSILQ